MSSYLLLTFCWNAFENLLSSNITSFFLSRQFLTYASPIWINAGVGDRANYLLWISTSHLHHSTHMHHAGSRTELTKRISSRSSTYGMLSYFYRQYGAEGARKCICLRAYFFLFSPPSSNGRLLWLRERERHTERDSQSEDRRNTEIRRRVAIAKQDKYIDRWTFNTNGCTSDGF